MIFDAIHVIDSGKLFKDLGTAEVMKKLEGQPCPLCHANKLTLSEDELEVPSFGKLFVFGMYCDACSFHKGDVECAEQRDPCKIIFPVEREADMNVRVIKSSNAALKIPELRLSVTPGPASEGYVSNVEGVLDRFKDIIEQERDTAEDDEEKVKCKNLLKRLWKVKLGDVPVRIVIEDQSGNSAIISPKAKTEKLRAGAEA